MAWFPNAGSSLRRPPNPAITFMTIDRVLALALVLLKASRGGADAYDQLHAFIYSCLIYDQYATEWKRQNGATGSQRDSWIELASLQSLIDKDSDSIEHRYHSRKIGDVSLLLPVLSRDPNRLGRGAPNRLHGRNTTDVPSRDLSLSDFIEVAYAVRCNLLHGWYDIRANEDAEIILNTGLRFTNLVRWLVKNTAW